MSVFTAHSDVEGAYLKYRSAGKLKHVCHITQGHQPYHASTVSAPISQAVRLGGITVRVERTESR